MIYFFIWFCEFVVLLAFPKYIIELHHCNSKWQWRGWVSMDDAFLDFCPQTAVYSTFQFFMAFEREFMTLWDILYILRYSTIQFCRLISSFFFFKSILELALFVRFVFTSLRICWFIYRCVSVPIVPLWHPFCCFGNRPCRTIELYVSTFICAFRIPTIGKQLLRTRTHTHTHIYIYIYMSVCVFMF